MTLDYVTNPRTNGANPFKIFEGLKNFNTETLAWTIKRMPYDAFLRSAYWFSISSVCKSRAGMRCQVCNCEDSIAVHHRTYDTHGREHLNLMDLVVLCGHCHGLFHGHITKPPKFDKREHGVKLKRTTIIPHSETDIKVPDGSSIVLTKQLIDACRANGSFTNATINALGITRSTMISGWAERLVGATLTREQYRAAQEGRFIYRDKLKRN